MTDGGHVPNEGLPEHLLAGPDPLGGPEGAAAVAPGQGVATDGTGLPGTLPPHGVPAQGTPLGAPGVPGTPGIPGGVGVGVGDGWTVDPGAQRPAFHFVDQPDGLDDEDDVLLMPGPQGSWGEPAADQQTPPGTPVEPSWPPLDPPVLGAAHGAAHAQAPQVPPHAQPAPGAQTVPVQGQGPDAMTAAQPPRRPLHAGPPIPDPSLMTGQVPVRSLADRGPSTGATPAHGIPVVPAGLQPEPQAVPVAPAPGVPAAVAAPGAPVAQPVPAAQPVETAAQPAAAPVEAPVPVAEAVAASAEPVENAEAVAVPAAPTEAAVPVEAVAQPVAPAGVPETAEPAAAHAVPVAPVAHAEPVAVPAAEAPAEAVVEQSEQPVEVVAEPVPGETSAAPAGPPRRISAFLAAPTPHGLPQVEAVAQPAPAAAPVAVPETEQSAPIAPAAEAPAEPVVEVQAEQAAQAEPAVPAQAEQPVAEPAEPAAEPAESVAPVAEQAVTEQPVVEAPAEPVVEPVTEAVAETAAGTGEMPSGRPVPVAVPVAEAPAEEQPVPEAPVAAEQPVVEQPGVEPTPAEQPAEAPVPAEAAPATEAPAEAEATAPTATAEAAEAATQPAEPAAAATEATEAAEATEVETGAGSETEAESAPDSEDAEAAAEPAEPRGPAAPGYDDAGREAVHQVIRERRDVRNGFRPDPIPHEVLIRVLEAAHTAPSVGYSQPWDFVVIRSAKTRRKMHELAERQREAYADTLPKGRAKQFKEIKIEAILETPVNIVVTADRTRGGRHTLGRHTQPQMAPYSSALAVENLWLAARAEGLGVGWVSFFDEEELVRELGLPEHLEVVAYLCVGFVDAFPDEPELQQQGWAKKRPLSWVVHEEQYGNRALPGEEPHNALSETLRGIRPLDAKALGEAWDRQKRMTKPAGSLGMLEIISAQLSGLSRKCPPPIPEPACVAVFAADHGVHAQGVSPWPQEVTAQMVGNFLAGGAVVNAFAKQIGTEVCVVDVGVAAELPDAIQQGRTTGLLPRKVKPGTDDMTQGPAMTREEALKALEVGIETARDLVAAGNKALITGDMGIANTTASAALISVFTGLDPAEVTGRGTGIDDETHARKVEVVRAALALHQPDPADPIGVLAAVGGLEHAALAGFLLGAASLRTPVILDGVIAGSAALVAKAIAPEVLAACIAGHRSAEPGHQAALAKLGLRPLIDLDLRLGEGTGALLALPLVQSAARAMHDVATFDSAGVTEKA
ncbi:nicotinate-nucleotide--dimethylbenzimidazole phosphoribosyltransferase [Kitasatospora sp. NPDC057541]|uniref:nicotinate-nucleotide--dimethylbenzimidazole phosphoribosyltransferase n=1 Tax=unclassified Kitasatospora TaxID=2633591 RepID=UPI0036C2A859